LDLQAWACLHNLVEAKLVSKLHREQGTLEKSLMQSIRQLHFQTEK
jgi:hypothetical protein